MTEETTMPVAADKKKTVREYVHHLRDLEVEKLTLQRMNDKLEQSENGKERERADLLRKKENAERSVGLCKTCYEKYREHPEKYRFSEKISELGEGIKFTLYCLFYGVIAGIILACVSEILPFLFPDVNFGIFPIILSVAPILIAIGFGVWHTISEISLAGHDLDDLQSKRRADWQKAKADLAECEKELELFYARSEIIPRQIEINRKNLVILDEMIEKTYALDIIPPDYRTPECIIALDHIFRNDLADTVRDGVLMYKEWVFQGKVIEGLENIYNMLGNLSVTMQYMQRTLESIEASVSHMASSMDSMVALQEEGNRTQEQILRESECTRRATEAIRTSNEKYEWYVEQHRQGLL